MSRPSFSPHGHNAPPTRMNHFRPFRPYGHPDHMPPPFLRDPWNPQNMRHPPPFRPPLYNQERPRLNTPPSYSNDLFVCGSSNYDKFPYNGHPRNQEPRIGLNFMPNRGQRGGYSRGNPSAFRGRGRGGFQDRQTNNSPGKKKKERVDKRDLAENNLFFCDVCERGFKTEEKYDEHVAGHEKCSYKNCPFVAAPKLVQLHMRMQHTGGLAKKVWSVASEEDIRKWKEERKRNYPTAENIAKKKELGIERAKRGELLDTKSFSKMKRGRGRRGGRGKQWRDYDTPSKQEDTDNDGRDDGPPEEITISVQKNKESNEVLTNKELDSTSMVPEKPSGLSLLCSYGESSSEHENSEDESRSEANCPSSCTAISLKDEALKHVHTTDHETYPGPGTPGQSLEDPSSEKRTSPLSDAAVEQGPRETTEGGSNRSDATGASGVSQDVAPPEAESVITDRVDSGVGLDRKRKGPAANEEHHEELNPGAKHRPNKGKPFKASPAKKKRKTSNPPVKKTYTLLERLLAPDIRRERNKILQCVHYIVKNGFFKK